MKIYARQIPPENQESRYGDDEFYDGITVWGNKDYVGRKTDVFERVESAIDDAAYEFGCIRDKLVRSTYKSTAEIVGDLLRKENGEPYSRKEAREWERIFAEYGKRGESYNILCDALSLVTGKKYVAASIKGSCQRDWNVIYYAQDDYTDEDIRRFEADYFNTGTEWMVHDGGYEPKSAEDIYGFCVYCYSWNTAGIREEIADCAGCSPEDVVLFEFAGYKCTARYNIA